MNVPYYEHGKLKAKAFDMDTSFILSKVAERGKCYENSLKALETLPDETIYHEGFAIFYSPRFFNLWWHCWLELNDAIIDSYPGAELQYGVIYFSGRKCEKSEAQKKQSSKGWMFALWTYHKALKPEGWNATLWNLLLFVTAAKFTLAVLERNYEAYRTRRSHKKISA